MDFHDIAYYPICTIIKILGNNYIGFDSKLIKDNNGNISYGMMEIKYENSVAAIEMSEKLDVDAGMKIIGTTGTIFVPEDWWRIGYFKLKQNDEKEYKRYSSNFEGNGFRYLIQALLAMIRSNGSLVQRITLEEAKSIITLLNALK